MALLMKLNSCNKISLQSFVTKYYRKLEKNGVNVTNTDIIELNDIKLCEGLIHQQVNCANHLNWIDFKLEVENRQVILSIQNNPFIQVLCNPVNAYNRISINNLECTKQVRINQSFSLAADLEDFYYLSEGRFKYFIINNIDFKLLIDKNHYYQLSQASEVPRNISPVQSSNNGAFGTRSNTQTSVNPIDQLCARQNSLRISSSSSHSSRSFPSPRNNPFYNQDISSTSQRSGLHHRGHRSPRQYRGPNYHRGTAHNRASRNPVPPSVPPRSVPPPSEHAPVLPSVPTRPQEELQIQDIQQNLNNSDSIQEDNVDPILPEGRVIERADRLLTVAEEYLRTSENAESPEIQNLLEEFDNNEIRYNLRSRERRSSVY